MLLLLTVPEWGTRNPTYRRGLLCDFRAMKDADDPAYAKRGGSCRRAHSRPTAQFCLTLACGGRFSRASTFLGHANHADAAAERSGGSSNSALGILWTGHSSTESDSVHPHFVTL